MSAYIDNYNIGYLCSQKQCELGFADKVAFKWVPATGEPSIITFNHLNVESNKFANVLKNLRLDKGDILFTFLPKCPEQFYTFLGTLKAEIVCGTLFSNFGDDALLDRLGDSKAKCVVTKKSFIKKLMRIKNKLENLKYIIVVDISDHQSDEVLSYSALMSEAGDNFITPLTAPETPSVLHYTSGSTGKPKGVLHAHRSVLTQTETARDVLQLSTEDVFWCTADQGWVTGTSYGIIGPWSLGVTQVHYGGVFKPSKWFDLLQKEKITKWYTAPTALRMLMREGEDFYQKYDLSSLEYIFSVGEPLNPEVIRWAQRVWGKQIYDTWFQTETGAIMIANTPKYDVHDGSMGKPIGGIVADILSEDGHPVGVGEQGNLCLKSDWPSMFITYLNKQSVYEEKFNKGFYYTGDTAVKDAAGYFWFKGRSDDVINTGGHLISPFEVESSLLELDEVSESGAIGVPDDILFEKVVAYVSINEGYLFDKELEIKMKLYVANKLSSVATPQEIFVIDKIPKNKSGKIMRRVLKARYLGLDEGDISTLEDE